jgi:6-phospho-beta-glucosidase
MKIAVIGAGSSYTPEAIDGLLGEKGFEPIEIALYDLPEGRQRAGIIRDLARRMAAARGASAKVEVAWTLEEALAGAAFVISQFRVGLMQARIHDEKIPLSLGLLGQETTGAGGFFKAMRTIPAALELAHAMERHCPQAWLINFTNPSGIVTEAIRKHSRIPCVGLCNVPYNMRVDAANLLGVPLERVDCTMVGLNHLSFVTEIYLDGRPVLQRLINEGRFEQQLVKNIPKVPGVKDLILNLRMVPSPYLQYFYFERQMLDKMQKDVAEGRGTRGEQILAAQESLFELYKDPALCVKPKELEMRGGAYYSTVATILMRALAGLGDTVMPVCYTNQGAISDLAPDAVVETNAVVSANRVRPLAFGRLPGAVAGLVQQMKAYESLAVEAAVEGSRSKAIQALLNNPLVHGYDNAVRLVNELIGAFPEFVSLA